ncbi:MAG TPA: shikimate dehydrogenase [Lapillicoccus sp.]|nr:shikimate dehydrogenase [Lapillicoccus sp.]
MPGEHGQVLKRAAVLGSPIAHSLSPALHTAGYRALGLDDWEYTRADVTEDELVAFVSALGPEWRGLSLTRPLKEVAFEVATTVTGVARDTGSINTLLRRPDGGWDADNTDVIGILGALAEVGVTHVERPVVVGSGATARSVVAAVAALGATRLDVMVRSEIRAATLAQAEAAGLAVTRRDLGDWPDGVDVVVSTVPGDRSEAAATLPPGRGAVLDVVYGTPSAFVEVAPGRGYAVAPGVSMLLHQAAEQLRRMTGRPAPVEAMRAALGPVPA